MYREVARPYIEGALIAGGALLATGTAAYFTIKEFFS